jgi:hypothetical protein
MRYLTRLGSALLAAAVITSPALAADNNSDLAALRAQVQALEQQLKILSRQIEIKQEADTAAAATTSKLTVNDKGVTLASPDGASAIKLHGLVQIDNRLFFQAWSFSLRSKCRPDPFPDLSAKYCS